MEKKTINNRTKTNRKRFIVCCKKSDRHWHSLTISFGYRICPKIDRKIVLFIFLFFYRQSRLPRRFRARFRFSNDRRRRLAGKRSSPADTMSGGSAEWGRRACVSSRLCNRLSSCQPAAPSDRRRRSPTLLGSQQAPRRNTCARHQCVVYLVRTTAPCT